MIGLGAGLDACVGSESARISSGDGGVGCSDSAIASERIGSTSSATLSHPPRACGFSEEVVGSGGEAVGEEIVGEDVGETAGD
jgi:hypothetical protein